MTGPVTMDAFRMAGYEVQDAHPAAISNDTQRAQPSYVIPPVVWMFVFLIVGYVGLRLLMED